MIQVWYDIESDGIDPLTARIVEISAKKYDGNNNLLDELYYVLNPTTIIPQAATDVHGFTNEDVKDSPTFDEVKEHIFDFFDQTILCGYNVVAYDNVLLQKEFERVDMELNIRESIDVYKLYVLKEKSKRLGDAYRRYCNKEMEGWHGADADILATLEIYEAQKKLYSLNDRDVIEYSNKSTSLDENNCLTFGKNKGKQLKDIDRNYLRWLYNETTDLILKKEIRIYFKK